MQVSPSELRSAATEMDRLADDKIGRLPVMDTSAGSLGTLSTFLHGADVAPQLDRIEPARTRSLQIVGGRYREFGSLLRTSAESYTDTDVAAAGHDSNIGKYFDPETGELRSLTDIANTCDSQKTGYANLNADLAKYAPGVYNCRSEWRDVRESDEPK